MWFANEDGVRAEIDHRQASLRAEMERGRWAALARQERRASAVAMGQSHRPWWVWLLPKRQPRSTIRQTASPGPG